MRTALDGQRAPVVEHRGVRVARRSRDVLERSLAIVLDGVVVRADDNVAVLHGGRGVLRDGFRESEFRHVTQQVGMEKLAVTTTSLCRTYHGLQTSAMWFDDADARLVDGLLLYIMQKGNMGRKAERGARSTRIVLHNFRNPVALLRYLHEGGRVHWTPARKRA